MRPILEIQNIGKKYRIQHLLGGYLSLRERMANMIKFKRDQAEDFWAVQNISFDVQSGESIGIIGRNGAGKSTLLKILSKITLPTNGRIVSRGRIASLLEVGTGFHPELTGRENIFFNGSLLGMKRLEIETKFDEMVDFSGVEKFLDTPLKHYSSGMQLRLAFAVAAFLNPEILIIDEVLAVGDAEFQNKCLRKMEDVSKSGRTILFVSHNMVAVGNLCQRALLLKDGRMIADGTIRDVINQYQESVGTTFQQEWHPEIPVSNPLFVKSLKVKLQGAQPSHKLSIESIIKSQSSHRDAFLAIDISNLSGIAIFQAIPEQKPFIRFSEIEQHIETEIDLPPLIPGIYRLSIWIGTHYTETLFWEKEIVSFEITESPTIGRNYPHSINNGFIVPSSRIVR